MQDKKTSSTYPSAVRGPLRPTKDLPSGKRKRVWLRSHDYGPTTLIAFVAGAAIIFGIIGTVVFYRAYQRSQGVDSKEAAYRIARKLAAHHPAETYEVMQGSIDTTFRDCPNLPTVNVVHRYKDRPALYTPVDLTAPDLTSALELIVERSDGAEANELLVTCNY